MLCLSPNSQRWLDFSRWVLIAGDGLWHCLKRQFANKATATLMGALSVHLKLLAWMLMLLLRVDQGRRAFEEKVQRTQVGPVDKNRRRSLAHTYTEAPFVLLWVIVERSTAVNSPNQSIRARRCRSASALTGYPERKRQAWVINKQNRGMSVWHCVLGLGRGESRRQRQEEVLAFGRANGAE